MPTFVVNEKGYFFELANQQDFDLKMLKEHHCHVFDNKEEMYQHVQNVLNLTQEELCDPYSIENQSDRLGYMIKFVDDRGMAVDIENECPNLFIINYEE